LKRGKILFIFIDRCLLVAFNIATSKISIWCYDLINILINIMKVFVVKYMLFVINFLKNICLIF